MVKLSSCRTRSGLSWFLRDGEFFYVGSDGQTRPWPPRWGLPRTSLEPTATELRRAEERERRHREVPARVARWREIARQLR